MGPTEKLKAQGHTPRSRPDARTGLPHKRRAVRPDQIARSANSIELPILAGLHHEYLRVARGDRTARARTAASSRDCPSVADLQRLDPPAIVRLGDVAIPTLVLWAD